MSSQTQAIIYLADQRGCSQTASFRSHHTFNFGAYFNGNRKPFGDLQVFNDDTLKGGSTLRLPVQKGTTVLLLPVVGALDYKTSQGISGSVDVGQSHVFTATEDSVYEISNPYEEELINFLHARITAGPKWYSDIVVQAEFNIDASRNQMVPLFPANGDEKLSAISCHLGKFDGRKEGVHSLKNSGKGVFVFVIEGAFEVQNRLLHPRDGLAIWNTEQIEFEALSNEAIILLLEC